MNGFCGVGRGCVDPDRTQGVEVGKTRTRRWVSTYSRVVPGASGRVLVVDDNKVIRQLIRVNLELEGFEVVTAADGAECLDVVHQVRPDVITLDVFRNWRHYAESETIPQDVTEAAVKKAGFQNADAIGPYMRALIALHHDTLGTPVK